jgi:hypothetical protein
MSREVVVETVYGKYHKYEVIKKSDTFGTKFYVHKDGKPFKGSYSSLSIAVEVAKSAG